MRRMMLIAGLTVAVVAFISLIGYLNTRPTQAPLPHAEIRIELTGTPGLSITGTYITDGTTHAINGTLPLTIETHAQVFQYTAIKGEQPGELTGEVFLDGKSNGRTTARHPESYIRAAIMGGIITLQTAGEGTPQTGL